MKEYWEYSIRELEEEFNVSKEGLSGEQVEAIRRRVGENVLSEKKKKSVLAVFFSQFCDLLIVILLIAAIISIFSGNVESTIVIILVLILNAVLGTVQHVKAQKSLNSLKELSSPVAKVFRESVIQEVPSREIVPGDVVILEAGDLIVADGRILHNYSLQVNESALTGESTNVDKTDEILEKNVPLADRTNMVYSGSLVTYGRAEVLVTATGMKTELGKIAGMMDEIQERKTPLQVSLDTFSKRLAVLIMIISGIVFGLCIYRQMPLLDSMMFAVALAVAAIPEALSSIVTIVQAMGTRKMAKEQAIIKELKAVESLGCVSVICSDKTGTLTQNKMTVQKIYVDRKVFNPQEFDITNQLQRYLLYDAILTNDSSIVDGKGIGDPTEYALLEMFRQIPAAENVLCRNSGYHEDMIRCSMERLEELPFDSNRKLMSTKYLLHGVPTILTKGAVDVLLERCTRIRTSKGSIDLTLQEREEIQRQNRLFSEQGLRVLAFAYRETNEPLTVESETGFTFLGLIAMVDPPRPEAIAAVADAKKAGIRTVMITGDHKITATAIAKTIGIYEDGDMAVTGMELDALTEEELDAVIERITVYARVSPENKIRIVEAWQRKGKIVSMTGDGVNDAPALKRADIGVAMGITGTEVSKDASAMILADDNFATIMKAVLNGRNVYRNIRNAILFLLSGNMAGILSVLYTSVMGLPIPFEAVHLLFINLLTDSLPAIAIGMEPSDPTLLEEKPRDPSVGILNRSFFLQMLGQGTFIAVVVMVAYYLGLSISPAAASTYAFATLTLARLFHGFNCRCKRSVLCAGLRSNPYSLMAFGAGVGLLVLVLIVPALQHLFSVVPMTGEGFLQVVGLAALPTLCIQLCKWICDWKREKRSHSKRNQREA